MNDNNRLTSKNTENVTLSKCGKFLANGGKPAARTNPNGMLCDWSCVLKNSHTLRSFMKFIQDTNTCKCNTVYSLVCGYHVCTQKIQTKSVHACC